MMFPSELTLKVTTITDLSDYVAIAIRGKNLITSKNIRMVQLFEHIDLREKKLL